MIYPSTVFNYEHLHLNKLIIYTGHSVYGAMVIVKQLDTHRGGHTIPVPGSICLESMLGVNNPNRYFFLIS
jgi:hypothetical protein